MEIIEACRNDLREILELQYLAYQSEAELLGTWDIPPLRQTLAEVEAEFHKGVFLKTVAEERIIGSVRGWVEGDALLIGKLIVHPDFQGRGLGTRLLSELENRFPGYRCRLFTSAKSEKNLRLYQRCGYGITETRQVSPGLSFVYLEKERRD